MNLVVDVVDLGSDVANNLMFELFNLILVRVAAHETKKFGVVIKSHICNKIMRLDETSYN
jgi:hypothetical protein